MQNEMVAWLFRRVPAEEHNQLTVVTRGGTEIAVQVILRIEGTFVAIKGRLAGSTNSGRVYFIPYASIDYFGFQRDVREAEFDTIFGTGTLDESASLAPPSGPRPSASAPVAALPPAESLASVSSKTPMPLKSEVLERFRSRIAGESRVPVNSPEQPADG